MDFTIRAHPNQPSTSLQLSYTSPSNPSASYRDYKLNYTDLSASTAGGSRDLNMRQSTTDIAALLPGHEYRLSVVGVPKRTSDEERFLWSGVSCFGNCGEHAFMQVAMTDPKTPDFNDKSAIQTTTSTITLNGTFQWQTPLGIVPCASIFLFARIDLERAHTVMCVRKSPLPRLPGVIR